jgi:hypothetical protein
MSATGASEVRVVDALFGGGRSGRRQLGRGLNKAQGRLRFRPSRCKALNLRSSCMLPLGTIPSPRSTHLRRHSYVPRSVER